MRRRRREPNPALLQATILDVVENQLRDNTPPEVRLTLQRLLGEGFEEGDARRMIGAAILGELHRMATSGTLYDEERYVARLRALPASDA